MPCVLHLQCELRRYGQEVDATGVTLVYRSDVG